MTNDADWFWLFDAFADERDLEQLRAAATPDLLDQQDEWGMTALHLAVATGWPEAVTFLLALGANTELRYHRTGESALHSSLRQHPAIVGALLAAGANPDAATYGGITARDAAGRLGLEALFAEVPEREAAWPPFRIQNAEHLAEHHHPSFGIPGREERERLRVGQAVDVHVHGIRKAASVKLRIFEVEGAGPAVRYRGRLDPAVQETNLPAGVDTLVFGPEHVATIYVPPPR